MCKPTYERQAFFARGHEKGWPQDRIQRAWDAFTAKRDAEAIGDGQFSRTFGLPPISAEDGALTKEACDRLRKSAAITEEVLAENEARRPGVNMASIRPGDEVTVRFVAGAVVQRAGGERLSAHMSDDGVRLAVRPEDIVSHTPRSIGTGDSVRVPGASKPGTVEAVSGKWAWVMFADESFPLSITLDQLERA